MGGPAYWVGTYSYAACLVCVRWRLTLTLNDLAERRVDQQIAAALGLSRTKAYELVPRRPPTARSIGDINRDAALATSAPTHGPVSSSTWNSETPPRLPR